MNFREIKEANKLIDEIKKLDSFTIDIQNPARTLKVCTPFDEVTIKKEHRFKVIQVLLGMRGELAEELEKLGVVEEYDD
jgi:hypothetical protein|uniref:Uncharacterized protein n=1 Tax=Siphoviridae sp. ctpGU1 TaxID=2823601 RepID=A0A8S5LC60_9CAUD|nr:MAG TPA: hypothetical protein [Siphoviridae sp. ctpGU1]DAK02123.1 MAG TPA: hypothetical protein [Caudoviricetes sp.]